MTKLLIMILNIILWIWGHSPILSLTNDESFTNISLDVNNGIKENLKKFKNARFSLINILLGEIQIVVLTVRFSDSLELSFAKIIQLSKLNCFILADEKADKLKSDYSTHYSELHDSDRSVEKDALCNHLDFEQERISRSFDKINSFTSVFLVIVPLLITTIKWKDILSAGYCGKILVLLFIYISVNIGFWIYQALSVRGTFQSSFGELKEVHDNKETEYASQIYFDWQQTKRNADLFVSIVLNLQTYVMVLLITISLIAVVPFIKDKSADVTSATTSVYNLDSNGIHQTYSEDAVKWNRILSELNTDEYHKIIILYNNFENDTLKEEIDVFKHQKIEWIYDEALEDNQIKIILED